uniref:Uncharacterized protein n=1 Tax=Arundo donax TaxID=35708 RepID=A0A0A9EVF3_ARUDO
MKHCPLQQLEVKNHFAILLYLFSVSSYHLPSEQHSGSSQKLGSGYFLLPSKGKPFREALQNHLAFLCFASVAHKVLSFS